MSKLNNKVAIVTGAGQGLGLAYAKVLAKEGASISIAEFNSKTGQSAAQEINDAGGKAIFVECDVSKSDQVKKAVEETYNQLGRIDILVNNAQVLPPEAPLIETGESDMEVAWRTGPLGTFFFMKESFPYLKENQGSIINIVSDAGIQGLETFAAYGSAKEAIRSLTKVAATEFGKDQVRSNCIAPAAHTPASDLWKENDPKGFEEAMKGSVLGRLGDPETDLAPVIVFLASEDSKYMTGQTLFANGGYDYAR